ncbi:ribosomal protein S5-alanine N-acetyltransferase [Kovacikia minuta CCNUW1]|uniref:ribosomal protein S5-alanine N-acetyltransferase n=1 Tax=Kovacikia minuta TaxID=2931930 RepID=UPI001CC8FCBB|nr:ribosomal protein S5-alanine N-acetyltransferase [Kovacikia minuta]UBF23569.1 ribosomal protein S5-alanine N-acetyltransferase [Kovacikia minuta CCNUW1]
MLYLSTPQLSTPRLMVRMANGRDASPIAHYYVENRTFLIPFEPIRPKEFFTEEFWRSQVERNLLEFDQQLSLRLFIFERDFPKVVIGIINFTQFSREPFHACVVGYSLAQDKQGKGFMQEALNAAIRYVFDILNYHRIMANYMPRNQRSGNLLKKLGFVVEGYARDYLQINGKWEDHILTSLLNPRWKEN